ncbi:MAG: transposase domain-containing protein, partial [Filomicrobium sp.]
PLHPTLNAKLLTMQRRPRSGGSSAQGHPLCSPSALTGQIETATLNGIDPQAWLSDILGRIADHKNSRIDELLPRRYAQQS